VVRSIGWESVYETRLAQENETIERNLLASLQAKYEGSSITVMTPAPSEAIFARRPVVSSPELRQQADVQFSLFG
jgi:hypothetical protein